MLCTARLIYCEFVQCHCHRILHLCVFVLSAFCKHYSPVESQTLRNRQFASSFVLTMRNRCVSLTKCLKTALHCDNVLSWTRLWIVFTFQKQPNCGSRFSIFRLHVIKWTGEDLDKVYQVIHEDIINSVFNILGLHILTKISTWSRSLKNLCPVHWLTTGNKTEFLYSRTCKIRP